MGNEEYRNEDINTDDSAPRMSDQEIIEIKEMDRAGQLKKSKFIAGIVSAVLGAVLLFMPGLTMELICQFLGAALGIVGVLTAAMYFTQPEGTPFRAASLLSGIPLALLGLFIFLRPGFLIEFIPIVIGLIVLANGVGDIIESVSLVRAGYDNWWISMAVALITCALGLLLIMRPFGIAKFIMRMIGAVTLYNGLSDIYIASRIKNTIKDI